MSIYNASLTSSLTAKVVKMPIGHLSELVDNSEYQIAVIKGDSNEAFFSTATMDTNPVAKQIYDQSMADNDKAYAKDLAKAQEMALGDDKIVLFISESAMEMTVAFPCGIVGAPSYYDVRDMAFAFQRNSSYRRLFKNHLKDFGESGMTSLLNNRAKLFKGLSQRSEEESGQEHRAFSYHNIVSASVVLMVGLVLALRPYLSKLGPLKERPSENLAKNNIKSHSSLSEVRN